jgi:hypothetical protein
MRRQRRISEFGEAEFLSALFHNALRRLEGRALEVLTFIHAETGAYRSSASSPDWRRSRP